MSGGQLSPTQASVSSEKQLPFFVKMLKKKIATMNTARPILSQERREIGLNGSSSDDLVVASLPQINANSNMQDFDLS